MENSSMQILFLKTIHYYDQLLWQYWKNICIYAMAVFSGEWIGARRPFFYIIFIWSVLYLETG